MRILFLNSNSAVASYNDVCQRMAEAMRKKGHETVIIGVQMITDRFDAKPIQHGNQLLVFKRGGLINLGEGRKTRMLRLREYEGGGHFDRIYMPQLFVSSAVEMFAQDWVEVADKAYFMADLEGTTAGWTSRHVEMSKKFQVYASSEFSRENITNLGVNVSGVFERFINLDYFKNIDQKEVQRFKNEYGEFVLAWCGMEQISHPRKGLDEINEAYWIAEREGKIERMPKCLVVTNIPKEKVEQKIHAKLHPKLILREWFGRLQKSVQSALYASAIYFIASSHSEGFGLLPLEANASGTPCVYVDSRAQNEHTVGYKVPVTHTMWVETRWDLIYKYFMYDPRDLMEGILYAWENRNTDEYKELKHKAIELANRYGLENYNRLDEL